MNATFQPAATPRDLLDNMFAVELEFLRSETADVSQLGRAFDANVVVHEPASLPYPGDWRGHDGLARLFRTMGDTYSDLRVEDMRCCGDSEMVHMSCILTLVCRASGVTVTQPFAETLRFRNGLLLEATPFYFDTAAILAALNATPAD